MMDNDVNVKKGIWDETASFKGRKGGKRPRDTYRVLFLLFKGRS